MRPFALAAIVSIGLAACSNREKERAQLGIRPTYDKTTGKLTELTLDSNHNGTVDTWTDMDGARPVQTRIDRNEDGKLDRWEYYDANGQLVKVGFSRKDDGKPDAWAYGTGDKLERIDVSSVADVTKIDRWERYENGALVSAAEDVNKDGAADKWETYEGGDMKTAAFDENGDGQPDRRLTYAGGTLVSIETAPDSAGNYGRKFDVK